MLGDSEHLLFGEAAKGHAILKGNHAHDPCASARRQACTQARRLIIDVGQGKRREFSAFYGSVFSYDGQIRCRFQAEEAAEWVRVESNTPVPVQADGEMLGRLPAEITLHPDLPNRLSAPLAPPQSTSWYLLRSRMLVDVFLLGIVETHKRLYRLDDALRVADEVAVSVFSR